MRGWVDPPSLRAAWWASRALTSVRDQLQTLSPLDVDVPLPPLALPERAGRGVLSVLARRQALCLERALILQRWLSARGRDVDVVIGVTAAHDFSAHAWLDGTEPESEATFAELLRRPVPRRPGFAASTPPKNRAPGPSRPQ